MGAVDVAAPGRSQALSVLEISVQRARRRVFTRRQMAGLLLQRVGRVQGLRRPLPRPGRKVAGFARGWIQSALAANPGLAGTTVERKASLLSLVLSPVSEQAAAKLRESINYQTQVTWNEPSQTLTDPPWLVVVKDIFVATLAFCGIAIVLGIAFGGVRVLTKRFFPGKVFDRPEDMEVLQLGLSGKRIDPRDFY